MQHADLVQYARSLYDAHGTKAEAEAARKAAAARNIGKPEDATIWEKIRCHINALRGPHAS